MTLAIDENVELIQDSVRYVPNILILLSGNIGDSSQAQVNSLISVFMESYSTILFETSVISEYALKILLKQCTPEFIALARNAMKKNNIWQGWVTEFECLYKIEKCSNNIELCDINGTSVIWPMNYNSVEKYNEIKDLLKFSQDNNFFFPENYCEPTVGGVYITSLPLENDKNKPIKLKKTKK